MNKIIITISILLFLGLSGGHFLNDHLDVSTSSANIDDVLSYNGSGWAPAPIGIDLEGLLDNKVVYMDGDSLSTNTNLSFNGNNEFEVSGTNATKLRTRATGTGTAWVEFQNSSQRWAQYVNGTKFGLEPEVTNGTWEWRDQGNAVQFSWASGTGVFDVKLGSQIRLTGKGGTGTGIVGLDAEDDLTELTTGTGLNISPAGELRATVFSGVGSVSGDAGDGQTLVITYPQALVSGVNTILATVKATGSGSPTGDELSVYVTTESTTGCTLSLGEQLEIGESVNISWSVHY